jgi:hypothetical protein
VATLFGTVAVRLPRFRCAACGHGETGIGWLPYCRSTPELDQLRAHVSALTPYRVAAGLLAHLLPVEAGTSPETARGYTLKAGEQLRDAVTVPPAADAWAITVTIGSTFNRGCHDGERHLEVRVANIETSGGGRRVFVAVAKADTEIAVMIWRSLETVGRTADTELTAFTDGAPSLRSVLAEAGCPKPAIADWFHIAMRLQHTKQAASGLSTDTPARTLPPAGWMMAPARSRNAERHAVSPRRWPQDEAFGAGRGGSHERPLGGTDQPRPSVDSPPRPGGAWRVSLPLSGPRHRTNAKG